MSPNDIYSKASQYLNRVSGESNCTEGSSITNNSNTASQTTSQSPAPVYYYSQAPLPPPVQQSFVPKSPSTPRIGNKIHTIDHLDLLFRDIPVKVGDVINPVNFYLVIQDKEFEYNTLKKELKNFYQFNCFPLPVKTDFYYAAKMENGEWGRVKVISTTGNYCSCLFIDEGVTFYLPEDQLFLLDDQFKKLPPRSFKAGLLGM